MTSDIEHIFMCMLAIYTFFFPEVSFPHSIWQIVFFMIDF